MQASTSAAVHCVDFQKLVNVDEGTAVRMLLNDFPTFGLQATQIGRARALVQDILYRRQRGDRVFLAYTSNLISSGLRDTFAYLARARLIDGFISSAGGIEEDVIKCLGDTVLGKFTLDGMELRRQGINRIGNLLVPNQNYCAFDDFFTPLLAQLHAQQRASRWAEMTAPSEIIGAMGRELARLHPDRCQSSLVYWCSENNIPMYSPALTDGSMGDMIYFYNFSKKGLVVDPVKDVVKLRSMAAAEGREGGRNSAIVLGAGLAKHHLLSNIPMDRVVMITTGVEADGCTSSCTIPDDISCGLIKESSEVVRTQGDATFVFPLLLIRGEAEPQHTCEPAAVS